MPAYSKPTSGWSKDEIIDIKRDWDGNEETPTAYCEVCGHRIRYVHILSHPKFFRVIETGGCCAERMCDGYNAGEEERQFKNRLARLRTFCEKGWKPSQNKPENDVKRVGAGKRSRTWVTVMPSVYGGFCSSVATRKPDCTYSPSFSTPLQAKEWAFDYLEGLNLFNPTSKG